MSAHTLGPWAVTGESRAGRYITVKAASGRTVARVMFSSEAEGEAGTATDAHDAALIAAAPEMLDLPPQQPLLEAEMTETFVRQLRVVLLGAATWREPGR